MSKYHGPPSRLDVYRKNMNKRGLGVYFVTESQMLGSFFATVEKFLPPGSRLLEAGYGPGTLGIYLSRCGYRVLGVDWDADIIELAKSANERLEGSEEFQLCEISEIDKIFGPDSFDAVISDVTLEHFDDPDIVDALKKQLVVANLNIFAVHCANLRPDIVPNMDGGERLLKPSHWEDLIRDAGGKVIDRFGYCFDATRMARMNWRILELAERLFYRRLAGLAGVTGFVVRRQSESL